MSSPIGGAATRDTAAIVQARQALAKASATVDADRAAHSPGCVACDQKLVDRAQLQLSGARAVAQSTPNIPGLSIIA